ncbi:MAG: hypothetical protein COA84_00350 [Robiginitomaculum sp.]|nr:MAG: hypothetical protein COA84_00350 [Robiginitomaculum sp.]
MVKYLSWFSLLVLFGSGVLLPEIVGVIQDGYSPIGNYLSELGAIGAPHAMLINYGSFLPIGLAVIILVFALYQKFSNFPMARLGILFLLGIAIGYLGAFFFHCDAGCPEQGTGRQALHNLGGLIEYTGAITGLLLIYFATRKQASRAFANATLFTVSMVILGFVMMLSLEMSEWKGAWQRLAEYMLVAWFVYAVFWQPSLDKTEIET